MDNQTAATPAKSGLIGRGKGVMKLIAAILAIVAAGGWISLGIGLFVVKMPKDTVVIILFVTAIATEALIWAIAALLGLSVFEARKRIWRRLTGRKG